MFAIFVFTVSSCVWVRNGAEASFSQPPGRGPVPVTGIIYTGPRQFLLEVVILVF